IDEEWTALNCSGDFLRPRKFAAAHDLHSTRRRQQYTRNQAGSSQRHEHFFIHNSQADGLEICVEVTTIDSAPAFFAFHNRRECLSVRIIDYADRKSTRLNSSHDQISYAVFC